MQKYDKGILTFLEGWEVFLNIIGFWLLEAAEAEDEWIKSKNFCDISQRRQIMTGSGRDQDAVLHKQAERGNVVNVLSV